VRVRRRLSMVSGANDVQLVVFLVPGRYESLITSVQYTSSPSLIAMVPCVLLKRRRQQRQKQKGISKCSVAVCSYVTPAM
jgi:hypothetical protein